MNYTTAALQWPIGWEREQDPRYSSFKTGLQPAMQGLARQLELMEAEDVKITLNVQLNAAGLPYARQTNIADTGVAVYFSLRDDKGQLQEHVMPCDAWVHVQDNVHALELSIEAMRGLERWGSKSYARAAFTGYKALPAQGVPMPAGSRAWHVVLGIDPSGATQRMVRAAYKVKSTLAHPDMPTGDEEQWAELQTAYQQGMDATRE